MGKVMLTLVVLLLGLSAVEACWPSACTVPEALQNRTCCPYFNGSLCGFSSGRGECQFQNLTSESVTVDDRSAWSKYYYDYTCVCKPRYYGPDCGSCSPAYEEPDCTLPRRIERPDITELNAKQLKAFLADLNYCKWKLSKEYKILYAGDRLFPETFEFRECSYYDLLVYAQYYAQRPLRRGNGFTDYNFHYESSGFLTRNRAMLFYAEYLMQLCTKNQYFVFPYHDYTRSKNCSICTNQYMGESNQHGELHPYSVFSTWRTFCGVDSY
uniref:Uncharacterized protein n=1 Tax=Leptobrachium leishanense TaxID=445787 RepID=A0A8C5MTN4_9ANUR